METIVPKGRNTILAHLEHLRDHKEFDLLKQAVAYIKENDIDLSPEQEPTPVIASSAIYPNLQEAIRDNKRLQPVVVPGPGQSTLRSIWNR
jgi:hypothetical protein